ncbi:unnamed protein product [Dibothriocephalus latus]|uniref:Uncharacterized protein n=1 Tax=Dibothriocephalus latus TaxID=60516 RepID=A0A3P7RI33_DIBLA|nr:unnamed protein product [Dibothriocephalus latus]
MVNGEQFPPPTSSSPSPDATASAAVASLLLRQARKPLQSLVVKNTLLESLRWQQSGGGGLLEPKRSATDKDADAQDLPDGPLDLRHPLRNIYTPQVSLAGEPVRQRCKFSLPFYSLSRGLCCIFWLIGYALDVCRKVFS